MTIYYRLLISLALIFFSLPSAAKYTALVIIDMQASFSERSKYSQDAENQNKTKKVLKRQIELIKVAKKKSIPIILIAYGNELERNGPIYDVLLQETKNYKYLKHFTKYTDGLFQSENPSANDIRAYLTQKQITSLFVAGANADACVRCSIAGALLAGYSVIAEKKAIIDFNYKKFGYPNFYAPLYVAAFFTKYIQNKKMQYFYQSNNQESKFLLSKLAKPIKYVYGLSCSMLFR